MKHKELKKGTLQTICSCGERFIYKEDFNNHLKATEQIKEEE